MLLIDQAMTSQGTQGVRGAILSTPDKNALITLSEHFLHSADPLTADVKLPGCLQQLAKTRPEVDVKVHQESCVFKVVKGT